MFAVIGSATVDLLIDGLTTLPTTAGDEFSQESLVFCEEPLRLVCGGNGANSAYVLAALGEPVTLYSALGRDELGRIMQGWLAAAGVDTSGLIHNGRAASSTTTVIADTARNRLSFHHAGAYASLSPDEFKPGWLDGVELLLLTSYPLLTALRPHYGAILSQARQAGIISAVDIGPAIGEPARLQELAPLLPLADYWLANEHEIGVCCGGADLEPATAQLLAAGAATVVVKRGAAGCRVARPGESLEIPAFATAVRSTVGAGDAFNAGFLCGLRQGWDAAQAARFGHATAALVIASERGVLDSPGRPQVAAFLSDPRFTPSL